MNKKLKKCLAFMLVASTIMSSVPTGVFAEESGAVTEAMTETITEISVTEKPTEAPIENQPDTTAESAAEEKMETEGNKEPASEVSDQTEEVPKETAETSIETSTESAETSTEAPAEMPAETSAEIDTETSAETDTETSTEAVTEAVTEAAAETEEQTEGKIETGIKTGKAAISVKTPGGKVVVAVNGKRYEAAYAEAREPLVLEETVETVIHLEILADGEGYEIGTYKVTMDSGEVTEKSFDDGTSSFAADIRVKEKETANIEVWFLAAENETEVETETDSETETEAETETLLEAESETEDESETEVEEIEARAYIGTEDHCKIEFAEGSILEPGNKITYYIIPDEGMMVYATMVHEVDNENLFGENVTFLLGDEVEIVDSDMNDEGTVSVSFIMPEASVLIEAAAVEPEKMISTLDTLGTELSEVDFTTPYGGGTWMEYPSQFCQKSGYGTVVKTFTIYDKNGKKLESGYLGYCLESSKGTAGPTKPDDNPGTKLTEFTKAEEALIAKAMYYLYLGNGFNKDFIGSDGEIYNIQKFFEDNGVTSAEGKYAMSHVILSRIFYGMDDNPSWSWNAGVAEYNRDDYTRAVLNDAGKQFVTDVINQIKKLDIPSCDLTPTSFKTSQIIDDAETGRKKTPSMKYTSLRENYLSIAVDANTFVVNETTGKITTNGTAKINGGDSFHIEVNRNITGKKIYTAKPRYFGNTGSYEVFIHETCQEMGFSYSETDLEFSITVNEWPEEKMTYIEVLKFDSITKKPDSRFSGAQYTLYSDSSCTKVVEVLTLNENGYAKSKDIEAAVYYLKETKKPSGYMLDTEVHTIDASNKAGSYASINVIDIPYSPVRVKKVSANPGITAGNGMYSLAGAAFELRNSAGAVAASFVTDANGDTAAVEVEAGTYTLVETSAPQGFKKAGNVSVTVVAGEAEKVITVADEPVVGTLGVAIKKKSDIGRSDHPLVGVEFKVEYFDSQSHSGTPKRTWVIKTILDDEGNYSARLSRACKVSGDEFYTNSSGDIVVPLGTLVYTETKAADGFALDSTPIVVPVTAGTGAVTNPVLATKEVINEQRYGGVKIDKGSIEQGQIPDGDASFAGAVFEIVNNSDWAVVRSESRYVTYAKGEVVAEIVTDKNGIAELTYDDRNYALEAGAQYIIREKTAPTGYLNDGWSASFTAVADTTLDLTAQLVLDTPIRGGFRQEKWDIELNEAGKAQGDATLKGAVFELYNSSASSVVVEGKTYAAGAKIAEFTTDQDGAFGTDADYLPYGTYTLKEATPPEGYTNRGENREVTFQIRENKKLVDLSKAGKATKNEPLRFDITIIKFKDTLSSEEPGNDLIPLEGVVFDIYLKSTMEKVMSITTDADGVATTIDRETYPHGALPYGKYIVKESVYPEGVMPVADFEVDGTKSGGVYDGKEYKGIYKNNVPIEAYIELRKADKETGETIKVSGAEFQILDSDKNVVEFQVSYPKHQIITNFTTDENGLVALPERLSYGTYYLHEVNAPYGYLLGAQDVEFQVTTKNSWENVITITYSDDNAMGKLVITKYDQDTKETISGAVFHVIADADTDIVTGDGTTRYTKGQVVDTIIISEDGTGESKALYVGTKDAPARYYYQEVYAPEGYCLDTERHGFTLEYKDQNTAVVTARSDAYNKPTTLKLVKEDIDGLALDGVTFAIEKIGMLPSSGIGSENSIGGGTFVTSNGGKLKVQYLTSGIYSIRETATLPGYVLDDTVRYFVVDSNGFIFESDASGNNLDVDGAKADTETLTWVNDYTKWDFSKIEVNGDMELAGAEMSILDEEGREVYSWTSSEELHRINKLPLGKYTLVEKAAPDGYVVATSMPFEVTNTGIVQKVTMVDKAVTMLKTDVLGAVLSGARFAVYEITETDGELVTGATPVDEWTTGEIGYAISGLVAGKTYELRELEAPEGYVLTEPVKFTVLDDGQNQYVTVIDKQVLVSKVDTEVLQLAGAYLEVRDSSGNVVDQWISDGTPHAIKGLRAGESYTLIETKAPDGYATAAPVEFIVSNEAVNDVFQLINKQVFVHKTDLTGGQEIAGAKLTVIDKETGSAVDEWISENEAHPISNITVGKTYILREEIAPAGYVSASDIEFTVLDDFQVQHVVMKDDVTKLEITKSDLTTGEVLEGAELVIQDRDGNEIERWITGKEPHYIEKLPVGTYTLTEWTAPEGYATAETITFTVEDTGEIQKVDMKDDVTKLEITKSDLTNGESIEGAELIITDSSGGEVAHWITTDEPYYIEKLPVGTYILTELTAPEGYVTAESITFTVEDTGEVQRVDMQDDITKLQITKSDLTTGKPVEGAELVIKDEDGNEVERWITTKEPHYIEMLPVGSYTLTEISAPKGYEVAETITFTVEDTGEIQKVDMKDKPVTPSVSSNVPKTGDTSNIILYVLLTVLSAAVLTALFLLRRRKHDRKK